MTKTFYAEVWSDHANLIAYCFSEEELDKLIQELKQLGWNQAQEQDECPEPWFVVDYLDEDEI